MSIIPELLEFLARNKHAEFPQKIFEAGQVVELNQKAANGVDERQHVCVAIAGSRTNFTEIKSVLDAVAENKGWKYALKEVQHPSFKQGRAALINCNGRKGIIGEISEKVLQNFGLKMPATVLEMEI